MNVSKIKILMTSLDSQKIKSKLNIPFLTLSDILLCVKTHILGASTKASAQYTDYKRRDDSP